MSNGWPTVRLEEVLWHRKEFVTIDDLATYRRPRVQLHAQGIVLRDEVPGALIKTKEQQVCGAGEFLVAEIDAKVGGFGIVPESLAGAIVSSHYFLFVVDEAKLDGRFLDAFIRTPGFRDQVEAQGSTNYAAIRPGSVLGYTMPLPPLPEQRRIVGRIEELAREIAAAQRLRAEVAEEAEGLFAAISRGLFDHDAMQRPVEDVASVTGGIQKGPHRIPGASPVRYLTVTHVQRNRVLTTDPRYFEVTPKELERLRLVAGDVLIIEGNGSAEQIGRTALFRGEIEDCVHQNHVIRIRPNPDMVLPEYLNAYLNCPAGQDAVQAQSRTTSGLRTLSVGRIRRIQVPVPRLDAQRRIVEALGAVQAVFSDLDRVGSEAREGLDGFMPAVLDRAFKGELT